MWDQLEPTPPHVAYLTISGFLIIYALFSLFIRNKLHLSEPPLAVLFGILLGPRVLNVITPREWGLDNQIVQEITRVILGVQCFAADIELPKFLLPPALEISTLFHGHYHDSILGYHLALCWLDIQDQFSHCLGRRCMSLAHRSITCSFCVIELQVQRAGSETVEALAQSRISMQ